MGVSGESLPGPHPQPRSHFCQVGCFLLTFKNNTIGISPCLLPTSLCSSRLWPPRCHCHCFSPLTHTMTFLPIKVRSCHCVPPVPEYVPQLLPMILGKAQTWLWTESLLPWLIRTNGYQCSMNVLITRLHFYLWARETPNESSPASVGSHGPTWWVEPAIVLTSVHPTQGILPTPKVSHSH